MDAVQIPFIIIDIIAVDLQASISVHRRFQLITRSTVGDTSVHQFQLIQASIVGNTSVHQFQLIQATINNN